VTTPSPLGGVSVDAAWDPESFGEALATTPASARVESDKTGHARLSIPMPQGDEHLLRLLLGLHHGSHGRTQVLTIRRTKAVRAVVHVSDANVVPGSTINAWVRVSRATSDEPLADADVEVSLLEGTYARARLRTRTDAAGMAPFRVPIPESEDPSDRWAIHATARVGEERTTAVQSLSPRDETPGAPSLIARFDVPNVRAGDDAPWSMTLRDGAGTPVAGAPLRYWIGQNGMQPPDKDAEWEKASKQVVTDLRGEAHGKAPAPAVVAPGSETQLRVVVRGELEGRKLSHEASVPVARSAASVTLTPEASVLVPGVAQHLFVTVRDGKDQPITGSFDVEADGLKERVSTDAHGEADLVWRVPADVGARRDVGPCAGGVAASVSVRPTSAIVALRAHPEPFVSCLGVDREAHAIVVPDKRVVRAGEKLGVRIMSAPGRGAASGPWSVVVAPHGGATTAWIDDGAKGGDVTIPIAEPGPYDILAASPSSNAAARMAHGSVLVLPTTVPHVEAKVVGGRLAPGGTVEVDAILTDESGKPLAGTVTAMLVDLEGGGSLNMLLGLDTRTRLCAELGVEEARCNDALFGGADLEPLRRAQLASASTRTEAPLVDPGKTARTAIDEAFSDVLHSLEGAVYEASFDPDRLVDVRRKSPGGFTFNPELLTLTTAAMDKPPLTPGGEAISLGDLTAVDPQVSYDNVARRVTRYKLFKVLSAVRTFKIAHQLDKDEPALRDPNALVRRLVRTGDLDKGMLVDPWGGSLQFVKAAGPGLPFLSTIPGFELRSPGPNGTLGDGDDLRDPFARVVKSGSPYANAMDEDHLVDAKLDMEVADTTVTAWSTLMDSVTGTHLGSLLGNAEGSGTGEGFGSGHGSLGGGSRAGQVRIVSALATGNAYYGPPQRTDAQGRVHFSVPLGDIETTWGLGLLALPDAGPPASTKLELAAAQPVSLSASAGSVWTAGDEMDVSVLVRNRTASPVEAKVAYEASGVATLAARGRPAQKLVHVEAQSIASFFVRVRAPSAGEATLSAKLEATGLPSDALRYSWDVLPPGEPVTRTVASWVEGSAEVQLAPETGDVASGRARLVLTRGVGDALEGALASLDPDAIGAPSALADAMEVASRVDRLVQTRGDASELHRRATDVQARATHRLASMLEPEPRTLARYVGDEHGTAYAWLLERRMRAFAPAHALDGRQMPAGAGDDKCPPALPPSLEAAALAVVPRGAGEWPCWETFIDEAANHASASDEPTTMARALLALADLPGRDATARSLADRLRKLVQLRTSGGIHLDRPSRADRVLVYAALLRANRLGTTPVTDDRLAAWIAVDRDASGSFGSAEATRAVVRALTQANLLSGGPVSVTVESDGASRTVTVGPSGVVALGLGDKTTSVRVRTEGGGVIARLERPMIRSFSHPPDASDSPLRLEVVWPAEARAGHLATLHVTMGNVSERPELAIARIPLPPGVTLAAPIAGVQQIRGAVVVSRQVAGSRDATIDVPMRFSLGGRATVREARIVAPHAPLPRGVAPSQILVVR